MRLTLKNVENMAGFVLENVEANSEAKVLTRVSLSSEDLNFYKYTEQISNIFLNKNFIIDNFVYQFLILIHPDLSADIYTNEDINISLRIKAKRDIKAGEIVMQNDVVDVERIKINDIEIKDTDKVIFCFKHGWRFGLFFDFTFNSQTSGEIRKFDINAMELNIGDLYKRLSFYYLYKTLEAKDIFEKLIKDGWFPFIEIISDEYIKLSNSYQNPFDFDNKIKNILDSFNRDRILKITDKWWDKNIISNKKTLIMAGINAYIQNNEEGFINCIKNLSTEIEGILRDLYFKDTGKGNNLKSSDLISNIINKVKTKTHSNTSLMLPDEFLNYLQNYIFANFDVENGHIEMSRNTSSHGVANSNQYTRERALQYILIIDQIFFYI